MVGDVHESGGRLRAELVTRGHRRRGHRLGALARLSASGVSVTSTVGRLGRFPPHPADGAPRGLPLVKIRHLAAVRRPPCQRGWRVHCSRWSRRFRSLARHRAGRRTAACGRRTLSELAHGGSGSHRSRQRGVRLVVRAYRLPSADAEKSRALRASRSLEGGDRRAARRHAGVRRRHRPGGRARRARQPECISDVQVGVKLLHLGLRGAHAQHQINLEKRVRSGVCRRGDPRIDRLSAAALKAFSSRVLMAADN